jgi:hypothetical protein
MSEPRRYFPDWTCCPLPLGREVEADHNSYLAGGYAEEFGYTASAEWSRGVPVLDEPPDRARQRRGQAYMTHPGYPLRAHPLLELHAVRTRRHSPIAADHQSEGAYCVVHVQAVNDGSSHTLEQTGKKVAVRLASSIVALRWALRHHVHFHARR